MTARNPEFRARVLASVLFTLLGTFFLTACSPGDPSLPATSSPAPGTGDGGSTGTGSAQVTVSWVAPLSRADGSSVSIAEIGGYRLYYGISSTASDKVVTISDAATTQYTVAGLNAGTYYFRVAAYDTSYVEGQSSAAMSKVIN